MAGEKEPTAAELETQAELDFASGADAETTATPVAETPAIDEKPAVVAETAPVVEVKPTAEPKYRQITEDEYTSLTKAAEKVTAFETKVDKVLGTFGDMQQIVKTLQSSTPRGDKVEIPKDAFAELEAEFPDLAARIRKGLENSLKGMTGTGAASADPDPAKFKDLVSAEVVKLEIEALEDAHPKWKEIVGAVTKKDEKPDPNNAFRKWLGTKDAAYQAKINGTNSAAVIARSIDLFQKETAKPAAGKPPVKVVDPKTQARTDRIAGAVLPKGDGKPPTKNVEEDEFQAGFKTG